MVPSFHEGHALLMGVGADLPLTIDDAEGIADILKDQERCAYPPDQVELLTSEDADRSGILAGLERLARRAAKKSIVVIYFSGHGYHVKSSSEDAYYLMPFGSDVKKLKDTAISGAEFADRLKTIKAQKLLLLLDCCHAGGLADLKAPELQFTKAPLPLDARSCFIQGKGRIVIASSQADEYSFAGKPYSAFTLALIDALCGAGASKKDGYVRVSDLGLHTREMVPKRTKGRQHPMMDFKKCDNFKLAYYAGGQSEFKGLPFSYEPEIEPEPGAWRSGSPIPREIPLPPKGFTGREEELKNLEAALKDDTAISLRGIGGVGKSALAFALAKRLRERFPDGQIFLDMQGKSKSPLKYEEAMAHIICSYRGIGAPIPMDANGLAGLYRTVLSDKKALILLDDARSREQVEPLLPPTGSALLITSQNKFALDGWKEDLDVLSPGDAQMLLIKIEKRIGNRAMELAELCGRLPIALRNAAYALEERQDLTPNDYLILLREKRKERVELVEASFRLSYELLSPGLRSLWSMLSIFPADFDRAGAVAVGVQNGNPNHTVNLLSDLLKWSLVDFNPTKKRYKLHDLARDFAFSLLDPSKKEEAYRRHSEHYFSVLFEADQLYQKCGNGITEGLQLFDNEKMNILAVWDWALRRKYSVFAWERIPGKDKTRLIDFLKKNFNIDWIGNAKLKRLTMVRLLVHLTKGIRSS